MEFEIGTIKLAEKADPPKIEVNVSFRELKQYAPQIGRLTVYIDYRDYTISELKTEAEKAAKKLISEIAAW